jgi:hypothetical protein
VAVPAPCDVGQFSQGTVAKEGAAEGCENQQGYSTGVSTVQNSLFPLGADQIYEAP